MGESRARATFHVLFGDASVDAIPFTRFLPTAREGTIQLGTPVLGTINGLRGRDVSTR